MFCGVNILGDPAYCSPEMLDNLTIGFRNDVWALGVLFFLLVAGEMPFKGENEVEILDAIRNGEPNFHLLKERRINLKIVLLIKKMLKKKPADRITIDKVIKHKVFDRIKEGESQVSKKISIVLEVQQDLFSISNKKSVE